MAGSQSSGSSPGARRRTLPLLDASTPASTKPWTLVFLALESVSAIPYSPSEKPYCANQASAHWLSPSKSPSCSASTSSRTWLMSANAVRTESGDPSLSSTRAYRVYTAMPGPIAAWARSTGAMLACF